MLKIRSKQCHIIESIYHFRHSHRTGSLGFLGQTNNPLDLLSTLSLAAELRHCVNACTQHTHTIYYRSEHIAEIVRWIGNAMDCFENVVLKWRIRNFDENLIYRFTNKIVVISIFKMLLSRSDELRPSLKWYRSSAKTDLQFGQHDISSLIQMHCHRLTMWTLRAKYRLQFAKHQFQIRKFYFSNESNEWNESLLSYGWYNLIKPDAWWPRIVYIWCDSFRTNWTCLIFIRCNKTGANKS